MGRIENLSKHQAIFNKDSVDMVKTLDSQKTAKLNKTLIAKINSNIESKLGKETNFGTVPGDPYLRSKKEVCGQNNATKAVLQPKIGTQHPSFKKNGCKVELKNTPDSDSSPSHKCSIKSNNGSCPQTPNDTLIPSSTEERSVVEEYKTSHTTMTKNDNSYEFASKDESEFRENSAKKSHSIRTIKGFTNTNSFDGINQKELNISDTSTKSAGISEDVVISESEPKLEKSDLGKQEVKDYMVSNRCDSLEYNGAENDSLDSGNTQVYAYSHSTKYLENTPYYNKNRVVYDNPYSKFERDAPEYQVYTDNNPLPKQPLQSNDLEKSSCETTQHTKGYGGEQYYMSGASSSNKLLTPKFKRSRNWGREETTHLLRELFSVVQNLSTQKRDSTLRSNSTFEYVADKLNDCGYERNAQACLVRWRNVLRIYKTQRRAILDSGGDLCQYPFAMEIENIFRNDLASLLADDNKDKKDENIRTPRSEIEIYEDDTRWPRAQTRIDYYGKQSSLHTSPKEKAPRPTEQVYTENIRSSIASTGPRNYFARFTKDYKPITKSMNNLNRCYSSEVMFLKKYKGVNVPLDKNINRMSFAGDSAPSEYIHADTSSNYPGKTLISEGVNSNTAHPGDTSQHPYGYFKRKAENMGTMHKLEQLEVRMKDVINSVNFYYRIFELSLNELSCLKTRILSDGSGLEDVSRDYAFGGNLNDKGTESSKTLTRKSLIISHPGYKSNRGYKGYINGYVDGSVSNNKNS